MTVRNHNREMEGIVASQQKLFSHSVLQGPLSEVKSMKCYGQIHTSVYMCVHTNTLGLWWRLITFSNCIS